MDEVLSTPRLVPYTHEPVRFTGTGGEYFRIWIVNLLLTIVTFGIYSAWAKVRRLHYFYRHTELAGSSFDFHGSPVRILIGRILALLMLGFYNVMVRLGSGWATLFAVAAVALLLPWLLRNSLRFRLYNTSWRGTRFHFGGSLGGAYRVFLLNGFITLITLYLAAPFAHQRLKAYQHGNSRFGKTQFSFSAGVGQFYVGYLLVVAGIVAFAIIGFLVGVGGAVGVLMSAQKQGQANPAALFSSVAILWGVALLVGLMIGPIFQAFITNLVWNNTQLGEHRIECDMSAWQLMWIGASNVVLVIVTLGLFTPWAKVRMARFQLECFQFLRTTDLQEFVDSEPEDLGAIGEEAASVFDVDISL